MDSEVMDRNFEALMHELAETKALREKLSDEPFFWSRLGFCYDPPRAGADGKQIIFSREFDEYNRIHRAFADAEAENMGAPEACAARILEVYNEISGG